MTAHAARLIAAAALLIGGCTPADPPEETAAPAGAGAGEAAVSPRARALIAEGDAAKAEADRLRAEAAEIERRLSGKPAAGGEAPGWSGGESRSAGITVGSASGEDAAALEARRAAALAEAERLERSAEDAWEAAMALDADAQRQIMERLLGSVPES